MVSETYFHCRLLVSSTPWADHSLSLWLLLDDLGMSKETAIIAALDVLLVNTGNPLKWHDAVYKVRKWMGSSYEKCEILLQSAEFRTLVKCFLLHGRRLCSNRDDNCDCNLTRCSDTQHQQAVKEIVSLLANCAHLSTNAQLEVKLSS